MEVKNQVFGVIDPLEWLRRPETVRNRSGIKFYESAMPKLSPQLRSVPKIQQFEDLMKIPAGELIFPLGPYKGFLIKPLKNPKIEAL